MPTIDQIKDGKHFYRCPEAYFPMYLALYRCHILASINSNQEIKKELRRNVVNTITEVSEYNSSKTDVIKDSHRSLLEAIETTNFAQLQKEFDSQLSNQSRFFRNFMKLFELVLLLIRASRDQLWELRFQSLHALCPYFVALDINNYAQMSPVYLSQMYVLKEKDPQTWEFLPNGGPDHVIEQENRALKVTRGIRGIAHSQQVLDEYFLTTAEIGNIVESFCESSIGN